MAPKRRRTEEQPQHVLGSTIQRRIGLALEAALEDMQQSTCGTTSIGPATAFDIVNSFATSSSNKEAPRGILQGRLHHYNRHCEQWRFVVDKNATVTKRPSKKKKQASLFQVGTASAVLNEELEILVDKDS